jgi:FKBP-type peptidyl-prolyl cis-trans isomerase
MRRFVGLSFFPLLLLSAGCQSQSGQASLETGDQKASYGIGHQMGMQLAPAESHLDLDAFLAGLKDGMDGADPAVPQGDIQVALQALNDAVRAEETARREEAAVANAAEGAAFLEDNATKDGITVTESGLQYEIMRPGDGVSPGPGDRVSVHYKGTLLDGTQFDSSYDKGAPAEFGVSGVIEGFSEGLQLMTVGSHYRFFIPSQIGYGPTGNGRAIGPNATLVFEVELLEIVE